MPHIIVEYTANLGPAARVPELLASINRTMLAQRDEAGAAVYPIGGVRSRAIALEEFCVADGGDDYAFVHVTLKIGAGRPEAVERRTGDAVFAAVKAHFAELYASRPLALSLELARFSEAGTWKQNNLHARFRRADTSQPGAAQPGA